MYYMLFVEVGHSAEELAHNAGHCVLGEVFVAFEQVYQRPAFAVLHNNVVVGFEVVYFVEFDDIGVIQLAQQVELC
jgi:hypothetical protein